MEQCAIAHFIIPIVEIVRVMRESVRIIAPEIDLIPLIGQSDLIPGHKLDPHLPIIGILDIRIVLSIIRITYGVIIATRRGEAEIVRRHPRKGKSKK
jgi:hypothetical protein